MVDIASPIYSKLREFCQGHVFFAEGENPAGVFDDVTPEKVIFEVTVNTGKQGLNQVAGTLNVNVSVPLRAQNQEVATEPLEILRSLTQEGLRDQGNTGSIAVFQLEGPRNIGPHPTGRHTQNYTAKILWRGGQ